MLELQLQKMVNVVLYQPAQMYTIDTILLLIPYYLPARVICHHEPEFMANKAVSQFLLHVTRWKLFSCSRTSFIRHQLYLPHLSTC